ncbi:MAG TPA: glycosyltransferase, partial [Trebonia sp.]|nr:glycosyltransferase [Trebonia sp.]
LDLLFLAYFARHTAFALSALGRPDGSPAPPPRRDGGAGLPSVSVLAACKNEAFVAGDLVSALLALDYPAERLQVIVVDDASTDGTGTILGHLAAAEPRLTCLRRPAGHGAAGNAGALNYALPEASGEIVVVFDADHRPHPDALRHLVRHFTDPAVGAVQGRCVIRNPGDAPITRLVAIDYLAGYLVNEYGRQAVYGLPGYGGANCAVRTASLRALGGWNEASVTEDTDLTLRLLLSGQRVRYEPAAADEEEGVVTIRQYCRQRYRWARGHQQCCRDYLGATWRAAHLSLTEKVETSMFLLVFHVPIVCFAALAVVTLWFGGLLPPGPLPFTFVLWTLLFVGPLLELGGGLLLAGVRRRDTISLVWFLPIFLLAGAICTKAWLDGMAGTRYAWVKTARAARPARSHP